ncbi:hypothetical protein PSPO01_11536 [Paraphaeosphaeria sporulosa]
METRRGRSAVLMLCGARFFGALLVLPWDRAATVAALAAGEMDLGRCGLRPARSSDVPQEACRLSGSIESLSRADYSYQDYTANNNVLDHVYWKDATSLRAELPQHLSTHPKKLLARTDCNESAHSGQPRKILGNTGLGPWVPLRPEALREAFPITERQHFTCDDRHVFVRGHGLTPSPKLWVEPADIGRPTPARVDRST